MVIKPTELQSPSVDPFTRKSISNGGAGGGRMDGGREKESIWGEKSIIGNKPFTKFNYFI